MKKVMYISTFLLIILKESVALGQIPVAEVGANLAVNTTTSLQSVITAAQTVYMVANQILELTPVDEIIVTSQLAEDIALLSDIFEQAKLLGQDLQSINRQITVLFDLDTAPSTRSELDQRLLEIKKLMFKTRTYALRTKRLIESIQCAVEHLQGLIQSIRVFTGNMQANQTLVQVNTTMSKTLVILTVQTSAWQQAEATEKLSEALIIESLTKITHIRLADHPRY